MPGIGRANGGNRPAAREICHHCICSGFWFPAEEILGGRIKQRGREEEEREIFLWANRRGSWRNRKVGQLRHSPSESPGYSGLAPQRLRLPDGERRRAPGAPPVSCDFSLLIRDFLKQRFKTSVSTHMHTVPRGCTAWCLISLWACPWCFWLLGNSFQFWILFANFLASPAGVP